MDSAFASHSIPIVYEKIESLSGGTISIKPSRAEITSDLPLKKRVSASRTASGLSMGTPVRIRDPYGTETDTTLVSILTPNVYTADSVIFDVNA